MASLIGADPSLTWSGTGSGRAYADGLVEHGDGAGRDDLHGSPSSGHEPQKIAHCRADPAYSNLYPVTGAFIHQYTRRDEQVRVVDAARRPARYAFAQGNRDEA